MNFSYTIINAFTCYLFNLVLYDTNQVEEPAYQYVPEVQTISNGADALSQSMLLLEDGLASGAILIQFDQLYRKKPGALTEKLRQLKIKIKNDRLIFRPQCERSKEKRKPK